MRQSGVGEERRSCAVASLTLASDQICGLSHSGSTGCTQHDVRWCGQRRFKADASAGTFPIRSSRCVACVLTAFNSAAAKAFSSSAVSEEMKRMSMSRISSSNRHSEVIEFYSSRVYLLSPRVPTRVSSIKTSRNLVFLACCDPDAECVFKCTEFCARA